MKDEVITNVLQAMSVTLCQEQLLELKTVLQVQMYPYEIAKKSTEVSVRDKNYVYFLNMFLARKKSEGKTDNTINQYNLYLGMMLQWLNKEIKNITEDDLIYYLAIYKKTRGVSNGYLDHIRLVFSSFFGWMNAKGHIPKNPAKGMEPIKSVKKIKKPFTDEELEIMRRACEKERDLAIIEVLYSTGIRVSELTSLNRNDVDFLGKEIIVFGKGQKERATYLNATAYVHLKKYLSERTDSNAALFVSQKYPYDRLSVAGVEKVIKDIGNRMGIEKAHPHRFRRTMATNILKRGMPIEEVKELLGHTKLDTTMIYCTVSKANVKLSHQKLMSA